MPRTRQTPYQKIVKILTPLIEQDIEPINPHDPNNFDNFFKKLQRLKISDSFPYELARKIYPDNGQVTIGALFKLAEFYHSQGRLPDKYLRRLGRLNIAEPWKIKLCSKFGVLYGKYDENGWGKPFDYTAYARGRERRENHGRIQDLFYTTRPWLKLRFLVLEKRGRKCECCGTTNAVFHVDHIKPRSKYPELALSEDNLQVLCASCNAGKGNWSETDFRKPACASATNAR